MVLINQKVADEIATLVARHRYSVEDSLDAVKAAESASSKHNEEIKEAAAQRQQELSERTEQAKSQAAKPDNEWANQRKASNEISFGGEDEEYASATPHRVEPRDYSPPVADIPPPVPPKPVSRRKPAFDEDDDYENESWLR